MLLGAAANEIPSACASCGFGPIVRENARRLAGRVLRAQEEERARISRELHDDMGQTFTLLLVRLKTISDGITDHRVRADLAELRDLVQDAIDGVHRLAVDLGPSVLDDIGLLSALEWLTERVRYEANIRIELDVPSVLPAVSYDAALALYRVYQEALTNIVRHARASRVRVRLRSRDDVILLDVKDDGVGFDVRTQERLTDNVGLVGMHDRMRLVGGSVHIASQPDGGTAVVARLPVSA